MAVWSLPLMGLNTARLQLIFSMNVFNPSEDISEKTVLLLCRDFIKNEEEKGKRVKAKETIRVRLNYTGIRPEDPKVYAIYVKKAGRP